MHDRKPTCQHVNSQHVHAVYAEVDNRVNYADLNNSVPRMRGQVSADFFRCDVLFLHCKHNGFRYIVVASA